MNVTFLEDYKLDTDILQNNLCQKCLNKVTTIFNTSMLLAGSVVEAVCIFDILHDIPENIRIGWNRYDISIVVGRQNFQVSGAIEPSVYYKEDSGKPQRVGDIFYGRFVIPF